MALQLMEVGVKPDPVNAEAYPVTAWVNVYEDLRDNRKNTRI